MDEAFTDRESELDELVADIRNGQDVVVLAPRRMGKTSLVWRAAQQLVTERVLVAQVNLMTTPTPAKLADKLARAIHDDIATPVVRAKERLRIFQGLRITPTITIDPDDGTPSFSFELAGAPAQDVSDTLERLLELPARLASDQGRRVALVFDEFQEIVDIDPGLPRLMRSVFQEQPDVSHVYLGSRRHMMRRLFSDEQEPFWRSAKQIELAPIPAVLFEPFLAARFADTGRSVPDPVLEALLTVTGGHPYATQELAYFLWQEVPHAESADLAAFDRALRKVLRSEHSHFSLLWERATRVQRQVLQALAAEPGRPFAEGYRTRHGLPAASTVQRAVESLERDEIVARDRAGLRIIEPFLAQWLRAER